MSFLSDLFKPETATATPTQVPVITPEQQQLMKKLTTTTGEAMAGPAPTAPPMFAPKTGEEDAYFSWVSNLSNQQALKNIFSGQPGYESGPEWAENYFEESVRPTYMREFEQTVLPTLKEAYAGPGYWGSVRAGAEAGAGSDLAYNLAAKKSELMYGEELAGRKSIDTAYDRINPMAQTMGALKESTATKSREISQEQVADKLQRFLMGEQVDGQYSAIYNPALAVAMSILGIRPFAIGTEQESSGAGLGYGIAQAAAGAAGSMIGARA